VCDKDESHGKENTIDMKAEEAGEDTIIDKEEIALLEEETTDDRKQSIYITTLPEKAKVIVDDSFHGISPFTLTDIPPGEHTLRFEKEGYRVHEKVVIVEEGQDISFEVVLKEAIPDMINIVIESDPPGAGIHLDGEYMGRSPRTIPDVEFGQHTVMIEMEGFSTINDVISVNDTGNKYLYPLIPVEIEE
jgi:hypothetical protein